ncbi:MAG: glycosyltransferase family 2 protein [Chloroflexota bacterium]|nr:glycosyltransferase family 2 protein [Chloroflexota bacterium]
MTATKPALAAATNGTKALAAPPAVRIPGSLSLVLPAHNEQDNIGEVVQRALAVLPAFVDDFEIIVVNDGSRDHTGAIADRLAVADRRVRVVHHPRNRGYGGALISGFAVATGDFVMFMDADRQFDSADIRLLAPFVRDFDIVAGFRMERHDPIHRRLFAEVFNVTVRILFGVHLRDIDCAFKIFRGDLLRDMELSSPGALINTEIQALARRQRARLAQVGVHHYPRLAGSATGGSPRVILRAMRDTIGLWWRLRRPFQRR